MQPGSHARARTGRTKPLKYYNWYRALLGKIKSYHNLVVFVPPPVHIGKIESAGNEITSYFLAAAQFELRVRKTNGRPLHDRSAADNRDRVSQSRVLA
jgi:hypothetical protein